MIKLEEKIQINSSDGYITLGKEEAKVLRDGLLSYFSEDKEVIESKNFLLTEEEGKK